MLSWAEAAMVNSTGITGNTGNTDTVADSSIARVIGAIGGGKVRVNRQVVDKSHASVRPGDVLTFARGPHIRVIEVLELGARRGPAAEARTLYRDLDPPVPVAAKPRPSGARAKGSGRPTKTDRRAVDRLKAVWRYLVAR